MHTIASFGDTGIAYVRLDISRSVEDLAPGLADPNHSPMIRPNRMKGIGSARLGTF